MRCITTMVSSTESQTWGNKNPILPTLFPNSPDPEGDYLMVLIDILETVFSDRIRHFPSLARAWNEPAKSFVQQTWWLHVEIWQNFSKWESSCSIIILLLSQGFNLNMVPAFLLIFNVQAIFEQIAAITEFCLGIFYFPAIFHQTRKNAAK